MNAEERPEAKSVRSQEGAPLMTGGSERASCGRRCLSWATKGGQAVKKRRRGSEHSRPGEMAGAVLA